MARGSLRREPARYLAISLVLNSSIFQLTRMFEIVYLPNPAIKC
jgi:hypothetical protein